MPPDQEPIARRVHELIGALGLEGAAQALDATPAQLRSALARGPKAHTPLRPRRWTRQAAEQAMLLALQVGTNQAARQLGASQRGLYGIWDRWGLGRPAHRPAATVLNAPTPVFADRAKAADALRIARTAGRQVAADAYDVSIAALYRAWDRWGLGRPTDTPARQREGCRCWGCRSRVLTDRAAAEQAMALARAEGVRAALRVYGVSSPSTLRRAWDRWGLGRPTDDPQAARRAKARTKATWG